MSECDHDYQYAGVVFEVSPYQLRGSGAYPVNYYDRFYCRKCLNEQFHLLSGEHNTYQKILYNAVPRSKQ